MANFGDLTYEIFPGRYDADDSSIGRYNLIFAFWSQFWTNVMRENGTSERVDAYEFLRSDFVAAIMNGDEVVALHLYSRFFLQQTNMQSHPYFEGQSGAQFFASLRRLDVRSAMTLEYLTVNPAWRKSQTGFSLAPVVVGLGYEIQKLLAIDATLGRCRQDNGVNRLMTDVGGRVIVPNVMMYNTPTDFCVVRSHEMRVHPDVATRARIQELWVSRTDRTGKTIFETAAKKIA